MNRFCANECDYHQQVIEAMHRFPDAFKSRSGLEAWVWGHEVEMHDAGRGGGNGKADLLTGDEEGMVWLIEAKFGYNPELSGSIWESQLDRYKKAIAGMSWQRLLHYCEAFLKGGEVTKPKLTIPSDVRSFIDVLEVWQRNLGRALFPPEDLNARMAANLGSGRYGIMVLADSYVPEVVECAEQFRHDGPLAYVQGMPTECGIDFRIRWLKSASGAVAYPEIGVNSDPRFDAWRSEVNYRCDPESFAHTLGDGARNLWLSVLRPGLLQVGWSGRANTVKQMAFNIDFEIKGKSYPLLVVGWSEADAKAIARSNKLAGKASMKVNPQLKRLLEACGSIDFVNRWAQRFYHLGWRGRPSRGMRDRWGVVPITEDELRSVEGVMLYAPDNLTRDHTGRPRDRESLEKLLSDFAKMLDDLNRL